MVGVNGHTNSCTGAAFDLGPPPDTFSAFIFVILTACPPRRVDEGFVVPVVIKEGFVLDIVNSCGDVRDRLGVGVGLCGRKML